VGVENLIFPFQRMTKEIFNEMDSVKGVVACGNY
jgi:hypothetical protein